MMITTHRHAAEGLFKRPDPEQGTDAAKLQDIRHRQALRKREASRSEMQERLERRKGDPGGLAALFR